MNIFDLRQRLIHDYSEYVKSFLQIREPHIQQHVVQELFGREALWPEPLIQMNPQFAPGGVIDVLVAEGLLHPTCARIFRRDKSASAPEGEPLRLHKHQEDAIRAAREEQSYVLTTGTGSGKSLAYMIPIVDYVLRHAEEPGIKAIVVYPMNALANSQQGELEKYLESGSSNPYGVRFARYTGQEGKEERQKIIDNPPDILLTNYVMLELLLTRKYEQPLIDAARLRFLVLDELHTYRGRQGADVALLVRRVRNRLTPAGGKLLCVGTSATLASEGDEATQRREVAAMASQLFGEEVYATNVIQETLVRVTETVDETSAEFTERLRQRVLAEDVPPPQRLEEFQRDPLAIWLESTFGVRQAQRRWVRSMPRHIGVKDEEGESNRQPGAATLLSNLIGVERERCARVITKGLLDNYEVMKALTTGRPPFAFRLHQFISKGDTVYATLEHPPAQHVTLQEQVFAPGYENTRPLLFPLTFCRECGQEYYCVRWESEQQVVAREFDDQEHVEQDEAGEEGQKRKKKTQKRTGIAGFLYKSLEHPWPMDEEEIDQKLPDEWKEPHNGGLRLKPSQRRYRPLALRINIEGRVVSSDEEGVDCHFIRTPFRHCLCCGVLYSQYQRNDFSTLALLSSEGRSTATTILSLSAIRHLREGEAEEDAASMAAKLLSFTDNRQDASLQAGHFNDFMEVSILRSALYRAVSRAGAEGLTHEVLTQKVFDALQLPPDQYALRELKFSTKTKTELALRNVLGYRLYLDLRRGWRLTSPNLEQCGLLVIDYMDLREICDDADFWQGCIDKHAAEVRRVKDEEVWQLGRETLSRTPAALKYEICRTLLDYMRRELIIRVDYLDASHHEELKQQSSQYLKEPWNIDEEERLTFAGRLFPRAYNEDDDRSDITLSGWSNYGQYVRNKLRALCPDLKREHAQVLIELLLHCLSEGGVLERVVEPEKPSEVPGYQLAASHIIWRAGDGETAFHDPLRMPGLPHEQHKRINPFFRDFYRENALKLGRLLNISAREHTAQVQTDERERREEQFRKGELPILYCSPTMELGIDISSLNVVNMRNIPPTPANYAQRSGRAGRVGQPALVFSYCSIGSVHDQYFFNRPEDMVQGAVSPPRIDLTNEDLIRAHVHAIWLPEISKGLGQSLKDLLDITGDPPSLQLVETVKQAIADPLARQRAEQRTRAVLSDLVPLLIEKTNWYTDNWLHEALEHVAERFDRACERWRDLYRSALEQQRTQSALLRSGTLTGSDIEKAKRLFGEAVAQLTLLTSSEQEEKAQFSEFYSYRYFGVEGFLPGYNFPRLPLSAYIPARRKQHDGYLSRPRFLAISEFAPHSIIYHEGSRYEIRRAILAVHEDGGVLTRTARLCKHCGYLNIVRDSQQANVCDHCKRELTETLSNLFRLRNVSTRRRDKINSDEEERRRIGYDIRTVVRFAEHGQHTTSFEAFVLLGDMPVARLTYGQGATLWRINFGPVWRKNKLVEGFLLDTDRGDWLDENAKAPARREAVARAQNKKWVIPFVEDTRNCLLFEPLPALGRLDAKQMTSLQAALKNAIQIKYQLEDNELAAEPLPDRNNRQALLFYEAAEGGAGVLRRLLDEPHDLGSVARTALELCHYDSATGEDRRKAARAREACVAACYHCLMNYTNQRDHMGLDRASIRETLMLLRHCEVQVQQLQPQAEAALNELEQRWQAYVQAAGYRLPSEEHPRLERFQAMPDFLYREQNVLIYVDGTPERAQRDIHAYGALEEAGLEVVRFGREEDWAATFARFEYIFRRDA